MKEMLSAIWHAAASLLGVAIFAAIMWWVVKAHSRMWRLVAERYSGVGRGPAIARKLETIVVTRRGALGSIVTGNANYRHYPGTVMTVTQQGLQLSQVPPLNVHCPWLILPFDQMELARTSWALWPEPFAIRMTNLPDIDIILGRDTVRWIRSKTDQRPFGWDV